jgi:hypothetical protein
VLLDVAPHHTLFGARVRFDAELSAVAFATHWLSRPIDGADPAVHAALEAAFRRAAARNTEALAERVRRALHSLADAEGPVLERAVARLFGLHERQFRRRWMCPQRRGHPHPTMQRLHCTSRSRLQGWPQARPGRRC